MTATADSIIERRRLRKRLSFWRVLAILALLLAVLALVPWSELDTGRPHVARVDISGFIAEDRERAERIRELAEKDEVRAVFVQVSSPGGTVVGSEALYEAIRHVAETKPVVALVGEIAASGGYVAALGADRIFVRRNSITGSIGVVSMVSNVSELLDRAGISVTQVKSAPLKAEPSPFSEPDPAALDALEDLILDSYAWFTGLVGERRGLAGGALETVSDGRVFTGAQAIELGLVDQVGGEPEALDWLSEAHGIPGDLEIEDVRLKPRELPLVGPVRDWVGDWLPTPPVPLEPGPRLLAIYLG